MRAVRAPGLSKYGYLACSRTLGFPSIAIYHFPQPELVTERLAIPTWAVAIAIYRVPAPWAVQVSLFIVFAHPELVTERLAIPTWAVARNGEAGNAFRNSFSKG